MNALQLISALGVLVMSTTTTAQTSDEQVAMAVKRVRELCLLGDQVTLTTKAGGLIVLRSVVPGAEVEFQFDKRTAQGATGYFNEEVRQNVDQAILDCIERQFPIMLERYETGQRRGSTIHSANGGAWGYWADYETFCPPGTYAYAFRLKVEPSLGGGLADDTALNAIQLKCRSQNDIDGQTVRSDEGPWGTWGRWAECAEESFFYAFGLKVEGDQGPDIKNGHDDTSANDIQFGCRPLESSERQRAEEFLKVDNGGGWGNFGNVASCPRRMNICGFATKIEPPQGEDDENDDTALNDVRFVCCM